MKFVIGVILGFLVGYQLGRSGESLTGSAGRLGQSAVNRARSGIQTSAEMPGARPVISWVTMPRSPTNTRPPAVAA